MSAETADSIRQYIVSKWDASVRKGAKAANVLPVPFPHTVPSPFGKFQVLFYWDTYFTNLGMIRTGRVDLAKSNCDALLWTVQVLGFVPNDVWRSDTNRSQPPYLCSMVRDVYEKTGDKEWLRAAYPLLETEWKFWNEKRTFPNGLSFHRHHADDETLIKFARVVAKRVASSPDLPDNILLELGSHLLAEAETGWDFTPLYEHRTDHFAHVELNSLLWASENNMAWFASELEAGTEEETKWRQRADARKELINRYLWDEKDGLYRAYDVTFQKHGRIAHAGAFHPLWAGLATQEQAERVRASLPRFEREFGVAVTEEYDEIGRYQWAYPNGWPPIFWIVAAGLKRYGFDEDARRIALKYRELQIRTFGKTGQLWEKFDVIKGDVAGGEYSADPMLGWTAGVFIALEDLIA